MGGVMNADESSEQGRLPGPHTRLRFWELLCILVSTILVFLERQRSVMEGVLKKRVYESPRNGLDTRRGRDERSVGERYWIVPFSGVR